ncbi:MAG: VWA domain-containing protein [bacterium]|nr:VWA domain-containing protein [bacterium]
MTALVPAFALMVSPFAFPQQPAAGANPEQAPPEDPGFVIRTETQLVLVSFHVVRKGQFVENLQKEDVRLLENGKPREIAIFEGPTGSEGENRESEGEQQQQRTIPVEIILLLDVSLSVMNKDLLDAVAIKETFFDQLGDNVSVSVYAFARRLQRLTEPTNRPARLEWALMQAYGLAGLGTRLYKSIIDTCRDAAKSEKQATRLMVVFSDGFSTAKVTPKQAVAAARQYGITLYPVILGHDRVVKRGSLGASRGQPNPRSRNPWGRQRLPGTGDPARGGINQQQRQSQARNQESLMADFADVGDQTGGRSFDPVTVNSLMVRAILSTVVAEVKNEYVVGYYPTGEGKKNKPRKVEIKFAKSTKTKGKIYGGRRLLER